MTRLRFVVYLEPGEPRIFLNALKEAVSLDGIRVISGDSTIEFSAPPELITDSLVDAIGSVAKVFEATFSEVEDYEE